MAKNETDLKDVFKDKVTERLAQHPNNWAGEDSAEVVRALLGNLSDKDGSPLVLSPEEEDIVQLASRPTVDVQARVIRSIAANHGAKFDSTVEGLVRRVVAPAAFKTELAKAGYIKEQSASGLKNLLG